MSLLFNHTMIYTELVYWV